MHTRATEDLDRLSTKLSHAEKDYEWARLRGDAERIGRLRAQMSAIIAERERLLRHLSRRAPGDTQLRTG